MPEVRENDVGKAYVGGNGSGWSSLISYSSRFKMLSYIASTSSCFYVSIKGIKSWHFKGALAPKRHNSLRSTYFVRSNCLRPNKSHCPPYSHTISADPRSSQFRTDCCISRWRYYHWRGGSHMYSQGIPAINERWLCSTIRRDAVQWNYSRLGIESEDYTSRCL